MQPLSNYDLLVTSDRSHHRYVVLVRGRRALLTRGDLRLLIELLAHYGSGQFVSNPNRFYASAIYRLRKAIDAAFNHSNMGFCYIETGVGAEYRLAPDLSVGLTEGSTRMTSVVAREQLDRLKEMNAKGIVSFVTDASLDCDRLVTTNLKHDRTMETER